MKLSRAAKTYLLFLIFLTVSVSYVSVNLPNFGEQWLGLMTPFLIFAGISLLIQIYEIELVHRGNIAITHPIFIATLLLGGLPLAIAVMAISTLAAELIVRWPLIKGNSLQRYMVTVAFNVSQIAVSSFAAAAIFEVLGGHSLLPGGHITNSEAPVALVLAASVGFLTYSFTSSALVAGIISLTEKTSFSYYLRFGLENLLVQILSLGALGILLAEVYSYSPWNLLLVLIPMGLVHASLRNYMRLRQEAQKTFQSVAQMLAVRDPYTYEHSEGVEQLAGDVARICSLSQDEIENVKAAALIHDIGKLAVPDRILLKPGPLTEEERKEMEKHPVIGAELLKNLEIYRGIVQIVRHEHERWDGKGYPDGLLDEKIPFGARIIAVADVYNALTTDRPYRKAFPHTIALKMIRDESGKQFDPRVVNALLQFFGELAEQPQPILRRAWQTAIPFTPILILVVIFLLKYA